MDGVTPTDEHFILRALEMAEKGMNNGQGGPFGCVIVKDAKIIAEGNNLVLSTNDPTAHAEMVAIRRACEHLNHFQLTGCTVYTSCEPCPMCLGALYWARPDRIVYASTRKEAAEIGFDDAFIYSELDLPPAQRRILMEQHCHAAGTELFKKWMAKSDRRMY